MKQFWIQILALLAIIFGALYYGFQGGPFSVLDQVGDGSLKEGSYLEIVDDSAGDRLIKARLNIEIADSSQERTRGLAGKEKLASDSGMLFTFETADTYKFWLKGMKIPIDFIWINNDRVVDLLENVLPPEPDESDGSLPIYTSTVKIDKVLEVEAGFISSHSIRIGDKIDISSKVPE